MLRSSEINVVMAALVAAIHAFCFGMKDVCAGQQRVHARLRRASARA
jgi:hypothetical protein